MPLLKQELLPYEFITVFLHLLIGFVFMVNYCCSVFWWTLRFPLTIDCNLDSSCFINICNVHYDYLVLIIFLLSKIYMVKYNINTKHELRLFVFIEVYLCQTQFINWCSCRAMSTNRQASPLEQEHLILRITRVHPCVLVGFTLLNISF